MTNETKRTGMWLTVGAVVLASGVAVDRWQHRSVTGDSGGACPAAAPKAGGGSALASRAGTTDGSPHLVVFSSADCPACTRLKPVLAAVERDCDAARDIHHIDMDDDPGQRLASAYGVSYLPTILSVDSKGREVSRLTGVQSAETIEQALEGIRGAKCASLEPAKTTTKAM